MNNFIFFLLVLFNALLSVGGSVLFKYGTKYSNGFHLNISNFEFNISLISMIGLFLYCVSFILGMCLVATNDLTKLIPSVNGLVFIFTILSGYFIFAESITIFKIMGIIFILLGIMLITIKG